MPRAKRGGHRGNNHLDASRTGNRINHRGQGSFAPFESTSTPGRTINEFSLQDEARNTERHHSFWNSDQRLRDSKVKFISAGALEGTKPSEDPESAMAEMTLDSPPEEDVTIEVEVEVEVGVEEEMEVVVEEEVDEEVDDEVEDLYVEPTHYDHRIPEEDQSPFSFIIDTNGSAPVQTGIPPPQIRALSPAPSNSSEEIILFAGRDQNGRALSRVPQTSRHPINPIDTKIKILNDKIIEKKELLEKVQQESTFENPCFKPQPQEILESSGPDLDAILPKKRGRGNRRGRRGVKDKVRDEEEEAIIADYIANIDAEDEFHQSFNQRQLGGIEDDIWVETEASSGEPADKEKRAFSSGWDRSDIRDFDDLSTSDGVMGDVQAILSKRDRWSGTQYLVVWEDQTIDEARWVPETTLSSIRAMEHIKAFEAEEKLVAEFQDNDEDTTDTEDLGIEAEDDDETVDEDEDEEDEADLLLRKIQRMSDDKIARLLAKQEELGMGSDELLLFDDEADDGDEDVALPKPTFSPFLRVSKKSGKMERHNKKPKGEFPAASKLADAYDGFDVMDFERPSLKKKPKGRKGKIVFDLSDSELEASMQQAWDNDRMKKKERKQEREELRAQGLLGSKNGKPDMKQKYKEGMSIHAAKEEVKIFLSGNNTTLALPPMDKAGRKVIHELANAFNLKSKSAGTGTKRFPILTRTARTIAYHAASFDNIEAKLSRRFLPRGDVGNKGIKRSTRSGDGGGFSNAGVSYRDGDIVGGSAPELGIENRGRAMLEKMGWSTGTALGALNNKGILQPVSHVVKTTKAGLG